MELTPSSQQHASSLARSRLAPTPSGYLHEGNAFNFILTWLWVRAHDGRLRLRIDDLDAARVRPEYLDDVFRTLKWLGLDWDEGPVSPDEHKARFSQRLRMDRYATVLEELKGKGVVYACSCSRKEIQQQSPSGVYPGTCRHKGIPFDAPDVAWRIAVDADATVMLEDLWKQRQWTVAVASEVGDFVVRRRDGVPAYHLASLTDDLDYGVTHIVRGEDLLLSTAAQLYLARCLNWSFFRQVRFIHHPLLLNEQLQKLSKSAGSSAVRPASREMGISPADVFSRFSRWMQWPVSLESATDLLAQLQSGTLVPRYLFGPL